MDNNLKIAFVCSRFIHGGTEEYILSKAKWLYSQGISSIIISSGGVKVKDIPDYIKHYAIKDIDTPPFMLVNQERKTILKRLKDIFVEEDVTIVEANEINPIYYCFSVTNAIDAKVIFTILSELGFAKNPILIAITKAMNAIKSIYTLNRSMKNELEKVVRFKLSNITLVPIPLAISPEKNEIRDSYILTVCRMAFDKMYVKYLIKDYHKLIEEGIITSDLLIVGDGPLLGEVEELVFDINKSIGGKIKLLGTIKGQELQKLFKECSLYVGMGTTLMNAGVYGKPAIIATIDEQYMWAGLDYFGNPNNDSFGQKNEMSNPRTFYDYIAEIMSNDELYYRHSKQAFDTVESNHSIDNVMNKWIVIYQKISIKRNGFKSFIIVSITNLLSEIILISHKTWRIIKSPLKILNRR